MSLIPVTFLGGPHDGAVFDFESDDINDEMLLWYYERENSKIEHGYIFRLGDLKAVYVKARKRFIESWGDD